MDGKGKGAGGESNKLYPSILFKVTVFGSQLQSPSKSLLVGHAARSLRKNTCCVIRPGDRVDSTTRDYLPQSGFLRMSTVRLWGSAEQSFSGTLLALLSASFQSWAVTVH